MSATVQLLRSVGFTVHPEKSVLELTHRIQYLGVIIDSQDMTVTLTPERATSLIDCCTAVRKKESTLIRDLAKVIGKIVAPFAAVKYGLLHYRQLGKEKKAALLKNKGDFDACITLYPAAKSELSWWSDNVASAYNDILQTDPDVTLTSDASHTGWGCVYNGVSSGGHWLPVEAEFHINYVELKAALFALQCFQDQLCGRHVRI